MIMLLSTRVLERTVLLSWTEESEHFFVEFYQTIASISLSLRSVQINLGIPGASSWSPEWDRIGVGFFF